MSALDKSTRRKIFYLLVLLFLVVVPLVLLYSRGYIVDLKSQDLRATGGIFVKTLQPGTRVFVDGGFQRETSFIARGVLTTNLSPKRYAVRVEKEGFRPWEKVVRIADGEVLEFRNIFLPPATVTPTFVFNTRRSQPARLDTLAERQELAVSLGEVGKPATIFFVNPRTRLSPLNLIKVSRWSWDPLTQTVFIGRQVQGRMFWYRLAISADGSAAGKETLLTFRGLPSEFSADIIIPHPTAAGELYFSAGGALFLQGSARVPTAIADGVHSFAVTPEHLYFISKTGFFVESDLDGGNARVLGRKGLFLDDVHPVEISASPTGDIVVRDSAGALFLYQPGRDEELGFLSGNVLGSDFSGNGDRLLFWDQNRLSIYWLRDNPGQPFDLAGTRRQVFFSSEPIESAFLNSSGTHIYFSSATGVWMTEVDDRGSTNTYNLVAPPIDSFLLDKKTLTLYWTKGAALLEAKLE